MPIAVCTGCGKAYEEVSWEEACAPGRKCLECYKKRANVNNSRYKPGDLRHPK